MDLESPNCPRCRYDLRGCAPNPCRVCPECGTELTLDVMLRYENQEKRRRRLKQLLVLAVIGATLVAIRMQFGFAEAH